MVLGNEVSGVSEEALSVCDLVCHIPMKGTKESLNVAVAFGIAAYEIARICKKLR
jgi:tRNA G18 (ribose-2'-O)-methylase SpoU